MNNYNIQTKKTRTLPEASPLDSVFNNNFCDYYNTNHRLENGLNLESLHVKVLNKTVTLQLRN